MFLNDIWEHGLGKVMFLFVGSISLQTMQLAAGIDGSAQTILITSVAGFLTLIVKSMFDTQTEKRKTKLESETRSQQHEQAMELARENRLKIEAETTKVRLELIAALAQFNQDADTRASGVIAQITENVKSSVAEGGE